jgi:hypothetical protein
MSLKAVRKIVALYSRCFQFHVNLRMAREKLLRHGKRMEGRVLDVGAGDQPYRDCFPNVREYVATNTRGHYPDDDLALIESRTDVWIEDATSLPFEDASFDAVLCFQVLSLIERPEAFFEESARILRSGGQVLLATDFLYPKWDEKDLMRHTDEHLRTMAEAAGFEVTALESFGGFHSMVHACFMRYVRSYGQQVTAARSPLVKCWRMGMMAAYMLSMPLVSAVGWGVYLLERNQHDAHDFTVNHLLVCRKK